MSSFFSYTQLQCLLLTACFLGCASGQGLIGEVKATSEADSERVGWEKALANVEGLVKRSSAKFAEAMALQADAEAAELRGDTQAANEARRKAEKATTEAQALEKQFRNELQQVYAEKAGVDAEIFALTTQLAQLSQSDPLAVQLKQAIDKKNALSALVQTTLNRINDLKVQVSKIGVMVALQNPPRAPNPRYGMGGGQPENYVAAHGGKNDVFFGFAIDWTVSGNTLLKRQQRTEFLAQLWYHPDDTDTLLLAGSLQGCPGQTGCYWDNSGAYPIYRCKEGCALRGTRTAEQMSALLSENPAVFPDGMAWSIGNEIGWDDDRTPKTYARLYCKAYSMLKAANPTFKIFTGALVPTAWLYYDENTTAHPYGAGAGGKRYYNHYSGINFFDDFFKQAPAIPECQALMASHGGRLPIDGVVMHLYPLFAHSVNVQSTGVQGDLDKARETILQMRQAMKRNGLQSVPLVIKEMSPGGNSVEQVGSGLNTMDYTRDFAARIFPLIEGLIDPNLGMPQDGNRLLQRWAWFYTEWNAEVAKSPPWLNLFIYDSRNMEYYRVDGGEPLAVIMQRAALAQRPKVPMYRMNITGAGNLGGIYQRIWVPTFREGKTIRFRATGACDGGGNNLRIDIVRYRRSDGAKMESERVFSPIEVCDGRWHPLALDYAVPSDTRELEVAMFLASSTAGTVQGATHDIHGSLVVRSDNSGEVIQEVIRNPWLIMNDDYSLSMDKVHPSPWSFYAHVVDVSTWGKVVPWRIRPFN